MFLSTCHGWLQADEQVRAYVSSSFKFNGITKHMFDQKLHKPNGTYWMATVLFTKCVLAPYNAPTVYKISYKQLIVAQLGTPQMSVLRWHFGSGHAETRATGPLGREKPVKFPETWAWQKNRKSMEKYFMLQAHHQRLSIAPCKINIETWDIQNC